MNNEDKIIGLLNEIGSSIDDIKSELASKPSREEMLNSIHKHRAILQHIENSLNESKPMLQT